MPKNEYIEYLPFLPITSFTRAVGSSLLFIPSPQKISELGPGYWDQFLYPWKEGGSGFRSVLFLEVRENFFCNEKMGVSVIDFLPSEGSVIWALRSRRALLGYLECGGGINPHHTSPPVPLEDVFF